jgi:hemoglobin-like flavoprotein
MYGMNYSQSMKQAQQSIEEIHSDINVSWIIPDDRLKQRRKFIETYNEVFGHNATVEYSDAWKKAYEKYMKEGGSDEKVEY